MIARGAGLGKAAVVAALALALDQLSKAIVRGEVMPGEHIDLVAGVDIVRVANRGIAFGMLDDAGAAVLIIAAAAFAVLLAAVLLGSGRRGLWLPVGLLIGGAVGNLLDRVREGYVTDFIDPPAWPAFNLADVEITVGVAIMAAMLLLGDEEEDEDGRPRGEGGPKEEDEGTTGDPSPGPASAERP